MRDILYYDDNDIRNLSLVDYRLALAYSLMTYSRRDIEYIQQQIFGKKKTSNEGFGFTIEHPQIEQWIEEQYENYEN